MKYNSETVPLHSLFLFLHSTMEKRDLSEIWLSDIKNTLFYILNYYLGSLFHITQRYDIYWNP